MVYFDRSTQLKKAGQPLENGLSPDLFLYNSGRQIGFFFKMPQNLICHYFYKCTCKIIQYMGEWDLTHNTSDHLL